jgi:polysaccharide deacetylase family protein (PEP-CTERM system associated)
MMQFDLKKPIISTNPKSFLLTIDVEDWFQVENLRPYFPPITWNSQQLRVEQNTHKILDLLDAIPLRSSPKSSKNPAIPLGTFFILGWVAERLPNLVREIQTRGHEVASHGYNHIMCPQMNLMDLENDLIRSKKVIEDIIGAEVKGYRAPNFSINDNALRLIERCGYRYDSSYNSFSKHGRYGSISLNGQNRFGAAMRISQEFMELPISNLTIGNQTIPWGGGGYFRFFPLSIFKAGVRHILQALNTYTFYMHPWEVDPNQPRVKESKGLSSWRHYLNLNKTHQRLQNLITTFSHCNFPTCSQYIDKLHNQVYQ